MCYVHGEGIKENLRMLENAKKKKDKLSNFDHQNMFQTELENQQKNSIFSIFCWSFFEHHPFLLPRNMQHKNKYTHLLKYKCRLRKKRILFFVMLSGHKKIESFVYI